MNKESNKAQNKKEKDVVKAAVIMIIAAFAFAGMGLFVKMVDDVPIMQKALMRSIVIALISFLVLKSSKTKLELKKIKKKKWLFFRCLTGTLGLVFNYIAMTRLMLADAAIIFRLSTIFILLLSALILKEKISKLQYSMVILAFIGVIFVVKPEFSSGKIDYVFALLGAVFAAMAHTALRAVGDAIDGKIVVFLFSVFNVLWFLPFVILDYKVMSISSFLYLIASAICATIGQYGITFAYKFAPAKEVSIYGYSGIIFSGLFGYLFFGDYPDFYSLIGYIIIFTASFTIFLNNKKQAKEE